MPDPDPSSTLPDAPLLAFLGLKPVLPLQSRPDPAPPGLRERPMSSSLTITGTAAPHRPEPSVKRFLTVDEAAELLRINRKTLYDHVATESPPWALRFGRTIRISRDGLLRWAGR